MRDAKARLEADGKALITAQNLVFEDERRVERNRITLDEASDDVLLLEKAVAEEEAEREPEDALEHGRVAPDLEAELDSWLEFNNVPTSENVLPDRLKGVFRERVLGRASPAARARRAADPAPAPAVAAVVAEPAPAPPAATDAEMRKAGLLLQSQSKAPGAPPVATAQQVAEQALQQASLPASPALVRAAADAAAAEAAAAANAGGGANGGDVVAAEAEGAPESKKRHVAAGC